VATELAADPGTMADASRNRRRAWQVPLVLLTLAVLALPLDLDVARWFLAGSLPNLFQKVLSVSEAFAHGFSVAMIIWIAWILDRAHRPEVLRIGVGTLLGGVSANLVKLLVARWRPRHFDLSRPVLESFHDWLPLGMYRGELEGFPSAHTATAFALAVMLSWRYPAARGVFFLLATFAGLQRPMAGAHFLSDVLAGAALGCGVAFACLPGGVLSPLLDRWLARLAARLRLPSAGPPQRG